jgi:hypothetical protein
MRFLRPRLRSLLGLVVLAAVCLGGVNLWRRSAEYSRSAWIAEESEGSCKEQMEMIEEVAGNEELCRQLLTEQYHYTGQATAVEGVAKLARFYRQRGDHYASLVAKYRRAARQPWLVVPPDPPLPEVPAEFATARDVSLKRLQ